MKTMITDYNYQKKRRWCNYSLPVKGTNHHCKSAPSQWSCSTWITSLKLCNWWNQIVKNYSRPIKRTDGAWVWYCLEEIRLARSLLVGHRKVVTTKMVKILLNLSPTIPAVMRSFSSLMLGYLDSHPVSCFTSCFVSSLQNLGRGDPPMVCQELDEYFQWIVWTSDH